jgi:hypothetical protein
MIKLTDSEVALIQVALEDIGKRGSIITFQTANYLYQLLNESDVYIERWPEK